MTAKSICRRVWQVLVGTPAPYGPVSIEFDFKVCSHKVGDEGFKFPFDEYDLQHTKLLQRG